MVILFFFFIAQPDPPLPSRMVILKSRPIFSYSYYDSLILHLYYSHQGQTPTITLPLLIASNAGIQFHPAAVDQS